MLSKLSLNRSILRAGITALASSALLLAGCSMQSTAGDGNSFVSNATIGGRIMGGNGPIAGATVKLYAVGTTGYGTGATLLATTTTSDVTGNFAFTQTTTGGPYTGATPTYICPSNSTLIYITASGGDPTGVGTISNNNSNIGLLAAIGQCQNVGSLFVDVDEVVTVASVAALQQYIDPLTEQIGAPSTTGSGSTMAAAQTAIANAFTLVGNLVDFATGAAKTTFTPASTVGSVTATVESGKINTIADILAACINTTGSSSTYCSSLFAAATPPQVPTATNFPTDYATSPTAADTVQAALFMLQNPTDAGTQVSSCAFGTATTNIGCLFNAVTSSGAPFPAIASAPTDWTIGVTYASASTTTISGNTVGLINYPQYLAVDKSGDIWLTTGVTPTATGYTSNLVELSPQGGIQVQALTGQGVLEGPRTPRIDPSGNVWVPNFGSATASNVVGYGKTVAEYTAGGSTNTFNVGGCPIDLASDGAGNIFVAECTVAVTNTGGGNGTPGSDVEEIPFGSTSGSTATVLSGSTAGATGYSATGFSGIAIDSNFDLWVTSGGTAVFAFQSPYTAGLSFTATDPEPVDIDHNNNAFVANYGTGGVDKLSIVSGAISNATGAPYTGGGLAKAEFSAIDGAGNDWITNYSSGAGYVSAFANTGAALSPATVGFAHTYYGAYGIAVDPSGNVWVGNNVVDTHAAISATATGSGGAAAGGFLTEIVGAAVPVVTPIAAGLPATAGGTSYIATPPQ